MSEKKEQKREEKLRHELQCFALVPKDLRCFRNRRLREVRHHATLLHGHRMRRRDYVLVIGILTLGWAFWLQRMGVNDYDDMLSNELIFARQTVARIVFNNPWPDQSPFFFLVLHGLRRVSESPFTLQFLNAVLLTMTLTATYALALAFSLALRRERARLSSSMRCLEMWAARRSDPPTVNRA